jgi:hypothetical protein
MPIGGDVEHRRREPRFDINQPVKVVNLDSPDLPLQGRIANFSANGTRLILERKLAPGTMIKVEWGTTILLGEVIYCEANGFEFAIGLQLEDALYEKDMFATQNGFQREQTPRN